MEDNKKQAYIKPTDFANRTVVMVINKNLLRNDNKSTINEYYHGGVLQEIEHLYEG